MEPRILRIRKGIRGFTKIDNNIFLHPLMRLPCKGLIGLFLTLPDNWKIHVSHLVKILPEGKDAIYSTMNGLIKYGFLEKRQNRRADGTLGPVEYYVHEQSIFESTFSSVAASPLPDNPQLTTTDKRKAVNNCSFQRKKEIVVTVPPVEAVLVNDLTIESSSAENIQSVVNDEVKKQVSANSLSSNIVEIYPCNDGVSKAASLLRHCLTETRNVELEIGETLTFAQAATIKDVANYFGVKNGESELCDWIQQSILSAATFSRCKTFIHKLNAIIAKIRTNSFTRPRHSPKHINGLPSSNALSVAHTIVAKHTALSASDIYLKALKEKIRTVSLKLCSERSAVNQFKNFPDMVEKHTQSVTDYENILEKLRAEETVLNQTNQGVTLNV